MRRTSALRVSAPEPVRPGDPDYALVRARRREPAEALPVREIEARLTRLRQHDLFPWLNYFLGVLRHAYRGFEERAGQIKTPRGAKTALIQAGIDAFPGDFTLWDLERACPGVSRDMVRRVLRDLQKSGKVLCLGRGPGAPWRRKGNTPQKR